MRWWLRTPGQRFVGRMKARRRVRIQSPPALVLKPRERQLPCRFGMLVLMLMLLMPPRGQRVAAAAAAMHRRCFRRGVCRVVFEPLRRGYQCQWDLRRPRRYGRRMSRPRQFVCEAALVLGRLFVLYGGTRASGRMVASASGTDDREKKVSRNSRNLGERGRGEECITHAFLNRQTRPNFSHCTHRG